MSSKKEDERNEKIIRGLMKLPPNRRCINCNSAGPQYVCTNFWTFVCLSCSGIHREFTHRVKSVSMAKFTKQEVEALQEGGNQRAREIYLKNWDMTRMRLPDSSNPDRIRDFIRSVYVNKKYAGERSSENPPKDAESFKANESDLKRPNSYHSFSQSPPYDYQYEERRYGKNSSLAPRRLASNRGYEGKVPSFLLSPGHAREHVMLEDRFANESSGSRLSDFSVSSAGEQFRYDTQSPNSQGGYASPNASYQSNQHPNARPQRTSSSGSFGSFDSNSIPESASEQLASCSQQLVMSPSSQRPPLSSNQVGSQPGLVRPAATVNQLPSQKPATSTSSDASIDLFAGFNEHNTTALKRTVSGPVATSPTGPALVRSVVASNQQPAQKPVSSTPYDASVDLFGGFNEQNTIASNRTDSAGSALTSPTGPALIRPATSFNQPPTQQPALSPSSYTYVDLFARFNEHNATGLNRTVSAELSVTSPTEPAIAGPASSFKQLPTQRPAASTPYDTSVDLFARFNQRSTTGLHRTVSAGPALMAPIEMDLFVGFNNQPPEVKDEGWANFNFSQEKQVAAANTVIQSPPVVTSSGNDSTSEMFPMIGQVPVNSANALPHVPQTVLLEPHVNQESFQPWNAFGESSNSGMYATNTQQQMPLPQLSMLGLGQAAPGHSAQSSSVAPVGGNEVAKPSIPLAVQLPVQKPMAPMPAQPQSADQWFASAHDSKMLPYQGISQSIVPAELTGAMFSPLQSLQGMPYQAMPSTNPFDFLDDSDLPNNTFMDMNSIQAALSTQKPAPDYYSSRAFWSEFYTQNPTSTYASQPQGDIQHMRDQVPNHQIQTPTPQGYPSVGSNPFA